MARAFNGMSGAMPTKKKEVNPLSGFAQKPDAQPAASGKGNPVARFGRPGKPADSGGKKSTTKSSPAPVSAAAKQKAAQAQKSADRYAQVQRAANKAKRNVMARKGPQDLAGREQRKMDLARYRELQAGADSWKKKAQGQGLRFGGDNPAGNKPQPARASGGSGGTGRSGGSGSSGGGSSSAGNAVARATGSQARPTANPTRPQAPKQGTLLAKAMKMENGGKGISISANELKAFMSAYATTHKGAKLSREQAVMMARLIKSKGGKSAELYGLKKRTPGATDSRAPGTGIH